jgi:acyl dehydratase
MLVVSYTLGLLAFDPDRVVALRRIRQATFKRPVMIGDTIHARCRIDSLTPIDADTGLVGIQADVVNQHGRLAVRLGLDAVWRRGDAAHAAPATDNGAFALVGIPL